MPLSIYIIFHFTRLGLLGSKKVTNSCEGHDKLVLPKYQGLLRQVFKKWNTLTLTVNFVESNHIW